MRSRTDTKMQAAMNRSSRDLPVLPDLLAIEAFLDFSSPRL